MTVFAVNRNGKEDIRFDADMRSFDSFKPVEYLVMHNHDMKAGNSLQGEKVKPCASTEFEWQDSMFTTVMKSYSWNVIRFQKEI